jgi:hypothetical protein
MESIILRRKISIQEDFLTAALADILTDFDDISLLRNILKSCGSIGSGGQINLHRQLPIADGVSYEIELWPYWGNIGEPDMVIWLKNGNNKEIAGVVVEVKYEASKSGEDTEEEPKLRDQLGRYAQGLDNLLSTEADRIVIYLTATSFPPLEELARSWKAISQKTTLDPSRVLGWISWRDIDRIFSDFRRQLIPDSIHIRRIDRVRELLARAGLQLFEGWNSEGAPKSPNHQIPKTLQWLEYRSWTGWKTVLAPPRPRGLIIEN